MKLPTVPLERLRGLSRRRRGAPHLSNDCRAALTFDLTERRGRAFPDLAARRVSPGTNHGNNMLCRTVSRLGFGSADGAVRIRPRRRPTPDARRVHDRARALEPLRQGDGRRRIRRRARLRERVLDVEAAGGAFAARSFLPRVLQAATATVLHHEADGSGRGGLRSLHGSGDDAARGGAARAADAGQRRQSAVSSAAGGAAGPAVAGRGRFSARLVGAGRSGGPSRRLRRLLPRADVESDLPAPRVPLPARRVRTRRHRRSVDPDGCHQPADRAFQGVLLGLHAAAQPGRFDREPAEEQRAAQPEAGVPRRRPTDPAEDALAVARRAAPGANENEPRILPSSGRHAVRLRRATRVPRGHVAAVHEHRQLQGGQLDAVLVRRDRSRRRRHNADRPSRCLEGAGPGRARQHRGDLPPRRGVRVRGGGDP